MKQKELTKTIELININSMLRHYDDFKLKNTLVSMVYTKVFQSSMS